MPIYNLLKAVYDPQLASHEKFYDASSYEKGKNTGSIITSLTYKLPKLLPIQKIIIKKLLMPQNSVSLPHKPSLLFVR